MKKKIEILIVTIFVFLMSVTMPFSAFAELDGFLSVDFLRDLEDVQAGAYTADAFETASGIPAVFLDASGEPINHNNGIGLEVLEEATGNKLAKFTTGINMSQFDSLYDFDTPIAGGEIEAGFKFKAEAGSTAWHLFTFFASNENFYSTIRWMAEWGLSSNKGSYSRTPSVNDATQMYHIRAVIKRDAVEDDWTLKMYDDSIPDSPAEFYSTTLPADDFANISAIKLLRCYTVGSTSAVFDDYFVRVKALPMVIDGSECEGAMTNARNLKVVFNGPIPNQNNVKLVKVSDENVVINATASYNAENYELTFSPKSFMEYNTEYKLVLENGGAQTYTFTTADAPLRCTSMRINYMQNNNSLTEMPSTGAFDAVGIVRFSNTSADDKDVKVTIVAYNEKGMITGIRATDVTVNAENTNRNANVRLFGLDASKVSKVKVFVWEKVTNAGYKIIP